jgi:hypothetical protein
LLRKASTSLLVLKLTSVPSQFTSSFDPSAVSFSWVEYGDESADREVDGTSAARVVDGVSAAREVERAARVVETAAREGDKTAAREVGMASGAREVDAASGAREVDAAREVGMASGAREVDAAREVGMASGAREVDAAGGIVVDRIVDLSAGAARSQGAFAPSSRHRIRVSSSSNFSSKTVPGVWSSSATAISDALLSCTPSASVSAPS